MRRPSPPRVQPASILLIDHSVHGSVARRIALEQQGHKVDVVSNAEEGAASLRDGHYDLVVTQLRYPKVAASEIVAAFRAVRAAIPVVGVAGGVEPTTAESNAGADEIVSKSPTEATQLLRAVERLLCRPAKRPPLRAPAQSKTKRKTS